MGGSGLKVRRSAAQRPAAPDYLARFLCVGYALALMASGCASRPLKGGRAVTTRKPAGVIEQTIVQSENPQLSGIVAATAAEQTKGGKQSSVTSDQ